MLLFSPIVAALLPLAVTLVSAHEHVLAVYIFSRHGDRTAKSAPPAELTNFGYQEVYSSGQYFRNRYIASDASYGILEMSPDLVKQSQIHVSAPVDTVLQNSAQGFLQGLYPPVGPKLSGSTLRNGTEVQTPMDGYQLIPISPVSNEAGGEDEGWLQGQSNCRLAKVSGQNFYQSAEYLSLLESTQPFYDSIAPMVKEIFSPSQISYKNAYMIYDALTVASLHNSTFPSSDLLTPDTMERLRTLAYAHEYDLAYNASDPIRAITGATTAADVVSSLSKAIKNPETSPKLYIHFGAYAGMLSLFGLADLPTASSDFLGIPDYASTLTWELVTNSDHTHSSTDEEDAATHAHHPRSTPVAEENLYVRFLFHNGTASNNISEPAVYPLFGQKNTYLPWSEFVAGMNKFSVAADSKDWCKACGNGASICAAMLNTDPSSCSSDGNDSDSGSGGGSGLTTAQAGVTGAMVALVVVLLTELAVFLVAGLRLVSKKKRVAGGHGGAGVAAADDTSERSVTSFSKA